jgi:glycosyltransferase involved in cell wall biosynthesis
LRILLAHSFYRRLGGEDRYVMRQLDLLSQRHQVELLEARNRDLKPGIQTVAAAAYSKHRKEQAAKTIRDVDPDLVHLHNPYPSLGPAVHLASRELGIPLIVTVHNFRLRCPNGLMFTEGAICRRCEHGVYLSAVVHRCFPDRSQSAAYAAFLWFHRFVLHLDDQVAKFVAPSQFMRNRLIDWGIPTERTETIPHFVEPLREPSSPGSAGVFIGRISPEKGVDVLLRALSLAGDPVFRIAGDGPVRLQAEALARDLGLRRTEFLGALSVQHVHELLEESRYLVMPSIWEETFGLSALEAMAHARPIVVTALGGLPELVRDDVGLTCVPGDAKNLAEKITILERDDEFCRSAGEQAWNLCRREYSPEVHLDRLETMYQTCLRSA